MTGRARGLTPLPTLSPFDATRKRVARTDGGGTLSLRLFRIDFAADEAARRLELLRVRSGYSAGELAAPDDPYGDKALHRALSRLTCPA